MGAQLQRGEPTMFIGSFTAVTGFHLSQIVFDDPTFSFSIACINRHPDVASHCFVEPRPWEFSHSFLRVIGECGSESNTVFMSPCFSVKKDWQKVCLSYPRLPELQKPLIQSAFLQMAGFKEFDPSLEFFRIGVTFLSYTHGTDDALTELLKDVTEYMLNFWIQTIRAKRMPPQEYLEQSKDYIPRFNAILLNGAPEEKRLECVQMRDTYALFMVQALERSKYSGMVWFFLRCLKASSISYHRATAYAFAAKQTFDSVFTQERSSEEMENELRNAMHDAWEALSIRVEPEYRELARGAIVAQSISVLFRAWNRKRSDQLGIDTLIRTRRAGSVEHDDIWAEWTLMLVTIEEEHDKKIELLQELCEAHATVTSRWLFDAHMKLAFLYQADSEADRVDKHLSAAELLFSTTLEKRRLAAFKVVHGIHLGDLHFGAAEELVRIDKEHGFNEVVRRRSHWSAGGTGLHDMLDQVFAAGDWDILQEIMHDAFTNEKSGPGHKCHALRIRAYLNLLYGNTLGAEKDIDMAEKFARECDDGETIEGELGKLRDYVARAYD